MKKSVNFSLIIALLLIVLTLVCAVTFNFSFGEKRIVATIESPKGIYYAEVVESDQGAFGGNTLVYI